MKITTKKATAVMAAMMVTLTLAAQNKSFRQETMPRNTQEYETLVDEDFSLFTAGSEANPDPNNIVNPETYYVYPQYTHQPGWSGGVIQQAGGICYFGDWYNAYINTPEFEMAGSVHISFRARLESGNPSITSVGLLYGLDYPSVIDDASFNMTSQWQTYEFDLFNPESRDVFIQINCYNEWFLDDFVVTRELNFTPAPEVFEATNYTMDGFTAHWGEVTTAEKYLLSVYKKDFYGPETVHADRESFENINNDGQWIDYDNPNFPEGWGIKLQAGNQRQVTNDAHSGNIALTMDAEGDTIILPKNGGRFLESTVWLKILEINSGDDSDLEIIVKRNGKWTYTGIFYWASYLYNNHANEWFDDDIINWIYNEYDEVGLAYTGEGVVWAIDDWDYTTSQACTVNYVFEDREVDVPNLSFVVTGLDPAEDHYYYVKAYNAENGASATSDYVSCFGLCPPIVEQASGIDDGTYTANWQAHPKADAYEIHNYYVTTAVADQPNALVFYEDFVQVHNGLEPQNYMIDDDMMEHRLDRYTTQPDWTGRATILAEGMLGASTNDYYYSGRVITPQITLNNAETFHLKVTIWFQEGAKIEITALTTGEMQYFEFAETGFQTLEMDFNAGPESGRERLKFLTRYGTPFLIDMMQITQDQHVGDKTYNILSWDLMGDGSTESFTYTGLDGYQWEDFAYDLIAIHTAFGDKYQSVNSDYIEVVVPLDVEENGDESKVSVYPNPAHDKFVIAGDVQTIEVFDMTGRCVKSVQTSALLTSVSTATFANGVYLLKVTAKDGSVTNQRIVVEN